MTDRKLIVSIHIYRDTEGFQKIQMSRSEEEITWHPHNIMWALGLDMVKKNEE